MLFRNIDNALIIKNMPIFVVRLHQTAIKTFFFHRKATHLRHLLKKWIIWKRETEKQVRYFITSTRQFQKWSPQPIFFFFFFINIGRNITIKASLFTVHSVSLWVVGILISISRTTRSPIVNWAPNCQMIEMRPPLNQRAIKSSRVCINYCGERVLFWPFKSKNEKEGDAEILGPKRCRDSFARFTRHQPGLTKGNISC